MEHIKKPIRVKKSVWAGDIEDAHGTLLCGMSENAPYPMAYEMVNAVNQHADLVAQRDALAAALAELVDRFRSWSLENVTDDLTNLEIMVPVGHIKAGIAALALVKGDQKSDDATA